MNWLSENWIWVLFGVAFIAMHMFGHGGHGGHAGHGGHGGKRSRGDPKDSAIEPTDGVPPAGPRRTTDSHRH